jgi:hypothetical protein
MAQHLPLDELSTVIARIQGLLLTEEKVTTAVRLLAQAAKESVPGTIGAGVFLLDPRGRAPEAATRTELWKQPTPPSTNMARVPCLPARKPSVP